MNFIFGPIGNQQSVEGLGVESPLRSPGEFFAPSPIECTNVTDFASWLPVHIGKLRPIPASTFVFKDLATSSHVFLRQGALREAPQAPYDGPYRVIYSGDKTYTIEVHGTATKVSTDRLKSAYDLHVNTETTSPPAIPSSITARSERRVGFPD